MWILFLVFLRFSLNIGKRLGYKKSAANALSTQEVYKKNHLTRKAKTNKEVTISNQ
jgi:hypothetical protein